MSILKRVWISNISENVASISLESLFPEEPSHKIKVESFDVEDDGEMRHSILLSKFSDLDLFRIKVEIEKYLYERDKP